MCINGELIGKMITLSVRRCAQLSDSLFICDIACSHSSLIRLGYVNKTMNVEYA